MMKMTRNSVRIDTKFTGNMIHVKAAIYDEITKLPVKIISWVLPLEDKVDTSIESRVADLNIQGVNSEEDFDNE